MCKIGMRFDGLRRTHYFEDGHLEDVIEFAMLRTTASVNFLVTSQPPSHGDRVIDHSDGERYG